MCRDAVRKVKAQLKQKSVRDIKNYKKEFFRYYHGLAPDHNEVPCIYTPPWWDRAEYQNKDKTHGLK